MQYSFDYGDSSGGGPHRPQRPERLIFMFRFDEQTSAQAVEIGQSALHNHHIDAALLRADRLHVSLYHIGDY